MLPFNAAVAPLANLSIWSVYCGGGAKACGSGVQSPAPAGAGAPAGPGPGAVGPGGMGIPAGGVGPMQMQSPTKIYDKGGKRRKNYTY